MEPESKEKDNFDLPPPRAEGGQPSGEQFRGETANAQGLEQGAATPPAMPPARDAGAQASAAAVPSQDYGSGSDPHGMASLSAAMPQIADDTDLIEKEWVDKAKAIVEQTAHDPYLQNQEINKVKVDYLKKRYNKDVKLTDD